MDISTLRNEKRSGAAARFRNTRLGRLMGVCRCVAYWSFNPGSRSLPTRALSDARSSV
jgi:hypothetical protein